MLKLQYLISKYNLQIKDIYKRLSISDQTYSSYPTSFSSSFCFILNSVILIFFPLAFLPLLPPIYLPAIGSIVFYWFEGFHSIFHFLLTFLFLFFFLMIFYFPIFSFLLFICPTFCPSVPLNPFPGHIYCIQKLWPAFLYKFESSRVSNYAKEV